MFGYFCSIFTISAVWQEYLYVICTYLYLRHYYYNFCYKWGKQKSRRCCWLFRGVLAARLLTLIMGKTMGLAGITQSESRILLDLPLQYSIDLNAIIFAGIIIGAVGAIMDLVLIH